MADIIYYVAMSLDGYIATPDGSVAWLSPFEQAGEDYGYTRFLSSVDAVLLGRRTYEQVLTFGEWPYSGKACWVFSSSEVLGIKPGIISTSKTPAEIASGLDAAGLKRAWLIGGGTLAAAFRAQGLITEYIVSLIPIILGEGIPLFAAPGQQENLRLVESTSYVNGLVQLCYQKRKNEVSR